MKIHKTFYMVYAISGNTPTCIHETFESAAKEAVRLSKKLGTKCYVLEAKEYFKDVDVEEVNPPKVYWFKQPISADDADALMWHLIDKCKRGPFADVPQNIQPGVLVYNNGNKICTVNDAPQTFADVLRMFGTELRIDDTMF